MMMKSRTVTKDIAVHPEEGWNARTKFHCNPSSSCADISVWTEVVNTSTLLSLSAMPLARIKI